MADTSKVRSIKYLGRDFQGNKRDLIRFAQAHHSGSFQDFNEASPGMAILEFQAYIGDMLSFYQDMQWEELKGENTRQLENAAAFAKSLGYRPLGKRASRGTQTFFIEVPAVAQGSGRVPDDLYTPILRRGTKVQGPNGVTFETTEDVNFSASAPTFGTDTTRMVTGSRFDNGTGLPTFFAVRKEAPIIAGETKTTTFSINDFQQFKTLELPDEDVLEVLSVIDSDGNEWIEVDFLAQEMVFDSSVNTDNDGDVVPYVLKFRAAPRRFITDRNVSTNKTSMIFGSGDGTNFDDELVPNLADLALPLPGRRTFSSFNIDPQNFLKTRSLGLSPYNTTLTVAYRVGGGPNTNVPERTIRSISSFQLDFTTTGLDPAKRGGVVSTLETINTRKTADGGPAETIAEIRANSPAHFAAQNRVVTKEDFIARVLSLPAKFGRPEKVFVKRTNTIIDSMSVDLHILSKDPDGHLIQATSTLAQNVKNYLAGTRILSDGVNILGADIINLKVEFGIVVAPKFNRTEILMKCLGVIRTFLDVELMQIGQPIVLSELSSDIQNVVGVISVYRLDFKSMFGTQANGLSYSPVRYDIRSNTVNNILYCPQNAIFEVKFPTKDIIGESK